MGQVVVAKKDGVYGRRLAHDLLKHHGPQRQRGRGRVQPFQRGLVQARLLQGAAPAIEALHHTRVELGAGKGNAAATAFEQVAGECSAGLVLAEAHAMRRPHLTLARQVHEVHTGHLAALHQGAGAGGVVPAGDQQAGGSVQQLLTQQLLFLGLVVMRHTNEGLKAARAQCLLRGVEQVHKQGVGQLGDQDGHMVAALRGQCPGGRVGHIAQAGGGLLHPRHQLGRHGPLAAQRA